MAQGLETPCLSRFSFGRFFSGLHPIYHNLKHTVTLRIFPKLSERVDIQLLGPELVECRISAVKCQQKCRMWLVRLRYAGTEGKTDL